MKKRILFIDSETPGYYFPLLTFLSKYLISKGWDAAIVTPSKINPYRYSKYSTGIKLFTYKDDGKIVSDNTQTITFWDIYASFIRQKKLLNKILITEDLYISYINYFNNLIINYKPNIIISENISNSFFMAAYRVSKSNQIRYLQISSARVSGNINFYDDLTYFPIENKMNFGSEWQTSVNPDYMKSQTASMLLRDLPKYIVSNFMKSPEIGFSLKYKICYTYWILARLFNKNIYLYRYRKQNIGNIRDLCINKIVFLFPLHFVPEASTSVQAKYFENQLDIIRSFSFSLKNNEVLLIKEHPNALGIRSNRYYKTLEEFPNTVIIKHDIPLDKIYEILFATITLTSTVGYESLLNKIPVILLGDVFYSNYKHVYKLESFIYFRSIIDEISNITTITNEDIENYKMDYHKTCFKGRFDYRNRQVLEYDNVKNIAESIIKLI